MRGGSVFNSTCFTKKMGPAKTILLSISVSMFCVSATQAMNDPTRPPMAKAKSSYVPSKKSQRPQWTLNSTLVSSARRTAVINDRVVSRGDRINGATVISIEPSSVRLRKKGREITLMMLKKNIRSLSRDQSAGQGK